MIANPGPSSRLDTTLGIIMRLAPRDYRETRDRKNRYRMICPVCNYVPRGGGYTAFSVQDDRNRWYCFTCGNGGGPREMQGHLGGDSPLEVRPPPVLPDMPRESREKRYQGATLEELGKKGLNISHLRERLKWRNTTGRKQDDQGIWYEYPRVEIPYFLEDGSKGPVRYRVGIDSETRLIWRPFRDGEKGVLYGLWNLARIRELGWVLLVEGETDFATLDEQGYPVLGVPGASMLRSTGAPKILSGLQVYLWREPDRGGDTFFGHATKLLPDLYIIEAPEEAKDPCDLALVHGARFKEVMDQLIQGAVAYIAPEPQNEIDDRPEISRLAWAKGADTPYTVPEIQETLDRDFSGAGEVAARGLDGNDVGFSDSSSTPPITKTDKHLTKEQEIWYEARKLFPYPSGKPWVKGVALHSSRDGAAVAANMLVPTWKNPINAQARRRSIYFRVIPRMLEMRRMIAVHSPMSWAHINMLGEYDFSDEKLRDSVGILPLKSAA